MPEDVYEGGEVTIRRARRADTFIRYASGWANVVGWITKSGGWSIADAGRAALSEFASAVV